MTGTISRTVTLLLTISLCGGPVLAQGDDDDPVTPAAPAKAGSGQATAADEALWKRLDHTEDGWLDGRELEGGWKRYDADEDGEVTKAEFMAGRARERKVAAVAPTRKSRPVAPAARRVRPAAAAASRRVAVKPAPVGKVEQPAPARAANGRPVGLFFMTRFWSYTGTLEKAAWYFAPDGRVYQNLEHGFSAQDLAAHKGPRGSFRVMGNTLQVTWADGKVTKSKIERDGAGFMWDGGIFTPVKPLASAKALAGTYEGGESLSHGGNHAAVAKTLRLRADGTFTWDGVSFLRTTGSRSQLSAGSQGGTTGTWKIAGYSLLLTDRGGTVLRRIAFPYDDEKTPVYPDRLFFGGTMYRRQ